MIKTKFLKILILILFVLISSLSALDNNIKIKAQKTNKFVVVNGINKNPFSVTVTYNASFKNLKSDKILPILFVLKPFSKKEVLRLYIEKDNFSFKAHYDWTIGSKDAKHDKNYIYRLPYEIGTKEMVSQGFNGKFSHYKQSQYAVDFNLKIGTKVYAAREGRVVKIKSNSNLGGANRRFEKDANYIIIEHKDGTLATYSHLKQNGVIIKVGVKIKKGQLLGYSGKTGYAQGAHLHFIVYKVIDGKKRKSFPIKFMSDKGIVNEPIKNQWYIAK